MIKDFLNKLSILIENILMTFKGLTWWQIAIMLILPDVLVILYIVIVKRFKRLESK